MIDEEKDEIISQAVDLITALLSYPESKPTQDIARRFCEQHASDNKLIEIKTGSYET